MIYRQKLSVVHSRGLCVHTMMAAPLVSHTVNNHMEQVHGLKVQVQKRYNCPFCKHDPFRTVTVLVGHCEKDHATKLPRISNEKFEQLFS